MVSLLKEATNLHEFSRVISASLLLCVKFLGLSDFVEYCLKRDAFTVSPSGYTEQRRRLSPPISRRRLEIGGCYEKRAEARSLTRQPTCFSTFSVPAYEFHS
jgi:hypothetical protein